MKTADVKHCYYVPKKHGIIDVVDPKTGKSWCNGETLEQIQERYPAAQIGDFDTVVDEQDAYWIQPPTEIDLDRFSDMLNVLPPEDWQRRDSSESFKMSERMAGNVTGIYCRIGARYWTLQDIYTLTHEEIMEKVRKERG